MCFLAWTSCVVAQSRRTQLNCFTLQGSKTCWNNSRASMTELFSTRPTLNPVSDPTVLAKMVDGLVMVVLHLANSHPSSIDGGKAFGQFEHRTRPQQGVTHCWHRLRLWSMSSLPVLHFVLHRLATIHLQKRLVICPSARCRQLSSASVSLRASF